MRQNLFVLALVFGGFGITGCTLGGNGEREPAADAGPEPREDAGPPGRVSPDDDGDGVSVADGDCVDDPDQGGFDIHPGADPNVICAQSRFEGVDVNCADPGGVCPGPAPSCADRQCCTSEDCVDADPCTGGICTADNSCVYVVAVPPPPGCEAPAGCRSAAECDDRNACSEDFCLVGGACDHRVIPGCAAECDRASDCNDGLFCNGQEACVAGRCVDGTTPSCDDGVACTDDSCPLALNHCVNRPNDLACGRREACHPADDCVPVAECGDDADCADDDGLYCTVATCDRDECSFVERDCSDGNPATADSCDEGANSCRNVPVCADAACSDGQFCNGAERCNAAGACVAGTSVSCDDDDPRTADSCDESFDRCRNVATPLEVCDGADNDGDSVADDGFTCVRGSNRSCTLRAVDGSLITGTNTCNDRCEWSAECVPPAEACNARDDDGDGLTDETFACVQNRTVQECTFFAPDGSGRSTRGTRTCRDDCTFGACQPPPEVCNGVDDDLDNFTDEGGVCPVPATRRVRCTTTTEGSVVFDRVNLNGCFGTQEAGFFRCEGPARDASGNPTWGDPIPGCAATDAATVVCTVDVPTGRRFRFNPHYYDLGGAEFYGCSGTPNADRDEDPGTVTCTVDGAAATITEVPTDFSGGCNLDIQL